MSDCSLFILSTVLVPNTVYIVPNFNSLKTDTFSEKLIILVFLYNSPNSEMQDL